MCPSRKGGIKGGWITGRKIQLDKKSNPNIV